MIDISQAFKKITTFIFDVDGVLTDGSLLLLENGLQARRMHIKDGFALQMAIRNGYRILIVSGANSPEVIQRLDKLGITNVNMSIPDKKIFIDQYMVSNKLNPEEVLYMGDDLPDLPAMNAVGLSCCPADAVSEIRNIAKYISPANGGMGCVRDVIENVLKQNDHWDYSVDITST